MAEKPQLEDSKSQKPIHDREPEEITLEEAKSIA